MADLIVLLNTTDGLEVQIKETDLKRQIINSHKRYSEQVISLILPRRARVETAIVIDRGGYRLIT